MAYRSNFGYKTDLTHTLRNFLSENFPEIFRTKSKADNGYRGPLVKNLKYVLNVKLDYMKSNFGTSEFKPINGMWILERTFSWLASLFSSIRGIS